MMESKQEEIRCLLAKVEEESEITILYACESGSRAWGFASPDSDYDIRFLFKRKKSDYLGITDRRDVIDLPIKDDLDPGGWDIRKALGLMGKSNGPLLEWLHSPIIYRQQPGFLDHWRETAARVFSPESSIYHYKGLAKQMVAGKLQSESVRAKDYLYALRSILAATWVQDGRGIPPVPFDEVLEVAPDRIRDLIPTLLDHKVRTMESERMERLPELDAFLEERLADKPENAGRTASMQGTLPILNKLFHSEVFQIQAETAKEYTLDRVSKPDVLLFETVAGSRAYGTDLETSDKDLRGVFAAKAGLLGGLDEIDQVADERGDIVYYELGRFLELLLKNNPNALELIAMPEDCVRYQHPLYKRLEPSLFLSKLCLKTFGEYAMGQIRKARGLNKKIVNPQPEKRHSLLSFCRVPQGQGSVPLLEWLDSKHINPSDCCLTAVKNAADIFAIYHDSSEDYRGIVSPKDPDAFLFASVPKEAEPICWMHCNRDAFRAHCKVHREYWQWVEQRNEERYETNANHGRGYDSKNLMHTIRLLEMAGEIASEGQLRIRRSNREYLLQIRAGDFSYDELVTRAENLHAGLAPLYAGCSLPEAPSRKQVNRLLLEIREEFCLQQ